MSGTNTTLKFGKSPEEVALQLLQWVANSQDKILQNGSKVDPDWVLNTYAQCLNAARGRAHQKIPN